MSNENTFGQDLDFLRKHVEAIVLSRGDDAKLACVPSMQGRIMTSTASGNNGQSFGFINYDLVASDEVSPVLNLYGGEDRIWVSPEGGQFSVFFDPGVEMDFANWRTPSCIDTEPYEVVAQDDQSVDFRKVASLKNWSNFTYELQIDRRVVLLSADDVLKSIGLLSDGLRFVGHESQNKFTNVGDSPWTPKTGLPAAWSIGLNKPSPNATVIVPFKTGPEDQLGKIVESNYFGSLDESRLKVDEANGLIFFLGDGELRSKLGVAPQRTDGRMGSWDAERGILSVVDFSMPDAPDGYTNNLWEMQDDPFCGDALNCYNDGPNDSGESFGGFFELETIGPALALKPGESGTHLHRTMRFEGERNALDRLAKHVFGVGLELIESQVGEALETPNQTNPFC